MAVRFGASVLNRLPSVLTPLVSAPRPSHFLLSGQEKVTKEKATPTSGSGLQPDFPRSGAAPGAVTKGRPCPFVPCSASMPRVPLRNTSTRPPDGDRGPSRLEDRSDSPGLRFLLHELTDDIKRPFQVPTSLEKFDAPKKKPPTQASGAGLPLLFLFRGRRTWR